MFDVLVVRVPGDPVPQGSSRAFVTKTGRAVVTSANKRLRGWRQEAAWIVREEVGEAPVFAGPVVVQVSFYFTRPKGHYGARGLLPSAPGDHLQRPDIDKCVRAVLDALKEGGAYRDDSQVVSVQASKGWAPAGGQGYTYVTLHKRADR